MNILLSMLLGTLLLGQLGGISLMPGVVVYMHDAVLLVLYAAALIYSIRSKHKPIPRLLLPIVSFVVIGLLSLAMNGTRFSLEQLGISSLYLVRWVFYAGVYAVAATGMFRKNLLMRGLYWYGVMLGVLGVVQYVLYPDLRNLMYLGWDPHHFRLVSTLLDPNFTGFMLVLTFLLGLYHWSLSKKNTVYVLAGVFLLVAIYVTYSRSAYLSLACGVAGWIIVEKRWSFFIVTFAALVLLLVLPISGGDTHQLFRADSSIARFDNWKESMQLILDRPIMGHGFNTLRYVWGRPLITDGVVSRASSGVDSSILFVLATTGIVGLISYGWIFVSAVKLHGLRLLPFLVALLVNSAFINSAFYPWVMIWMWLLLGSWERGFTSRT